MCFNRYHFTQLMRCQRYSDEVKLQVSMCGAYKEILRLRDIEVEEIYCENGVGSSL